jgi:hypothetical protein
MTTVTPAAAASPHELVQDDVVYGNPRIYVEKNPVPEVKEVDSDLGSRRSQLPIEVKSRRLTDPGHGS